MVLPESWNKLLCQIIQFVEELMISVLIFAILDFKASPLKISLQLDQSTHISNYSQLICFVCYIKEKKVGEEFLFCEPLSNKYQNRLETLENELRVALSNRQSR